MGTDAIRHMNSLWEVGILNQPFLTYLYLRQLSLSRGGNEPVYSMTEISSDLDDLTSFLIALCGIAEKELFSIEAFPDFSLGLEASAKISEEEVRRSQDVIDRTAYFFNAIQAEIQSSESGVILVDSAFRNKWGISYDDLIIELPKILKIVQRFRYLKIETELVVRWSPLALTHYPRGLSSEDSYALYLLGMNKAAFLFWVLQEKYRDSGGEPFNLQDVPEIGDNKLETFSALSELRQIGIIDYDTDVVRINWLKELPTVSASQMIWFGKALRPELRMAYVLNSLDNLSFNPSTFCVTNALTLEDFYSSLDKLAKREIINYALSDLKITWGSRWQP